MKNLLLKTLVLLFLVTNLFAQKDVYLIGKADTESPFNEVHCPNSTGLVNWLMRQNLTIYAYQNLFQYETGIGNNTNNEPQNLTFINYLPVISTENFGINVGVKYSRYTLMTDNKMIDKNYQYLWIWAGSSYKVSDKMSLIFSGEFYKRGNGETFNKKAGNQLFYLFGTAVKLSKNIMIMPMAGYNHTWKENNIDENFIAGVQLKWITSKDFQLLTGLPVILGCEWNVSEKINLGIYAYYNKRANGFIRYRVNNDVSLSLIFKNDLHGLQNTFLENTTYSSGNDVFSFDKLTQNQQTIAFEVGTRTINNMSVQFSAGYKFGNDIKLYSGEKELSTLKGSDKFFAGISIAFLQF